MPIPIECEQCHQAYNVDAALAGKKVKCKACGNLIRVPGGEEPDSHDECLSCGKPMAPGTRICTSCGFNRQTGQREMTLLDAEVGEAAAKKKRTWIRKAGHPLLESLDQLIKLVLMLALLGGIVVVVVRIFRSPDGFSFQAILPTIVVLGMIAIIMAPVTTLAVNITVRTMKMPPREDTYSRVALCLLLPFILSMIAGWPDLAQWQWVPMMGWPLAGGLLLYFLRAELVEYGASIVAAAVAIVLSLIVVNLANAAVVAAAGPLYGDMLPIGPWTSLATGHSPVPEVKKPPATVVSVPTTITAPQTQNATPEPTPSGETQPPTQIATTPPTQTPPPAQAPRPAIRLTTAPENIESDYLKEITPRPPEFNGVGTLVVPPGPSDAMLTVKSKELSTEVQRWTLNPLTKKEQVSGIAYFAKKPAVFALAPKGDAVVALAFFPRRELQITSFDGKTPKKNFPLEDTAFIPSEAIGSIPGYLDANKFCLRWDYNKATVVQVISAINGGESKRMAIDVAVPDVSSTVISPIGHIMAIFGVSAQGSPKNQLIICNMDTGTIQRRIDVSDLPVRLLGMAFSPDTLPQQQQVAVYAAIADLPTVISFKVATGDIVFQNLLSQTPLDKDAEASPHALLWLAGNQALLLNGNDFLSTTTGTKFASLEIPGIVDQQVVNSGTLGLILRNPDGTTRLALAKLNDANIKAATPK